MKSVSLPSTRKCGVIVANFGGPRSLDEVRGFLNELLCDKDVLQTPLPQFLHTALFSLVAAFRSRRISKEYQHMGGFSPIYGSTEALGNYVRSKLKMPVWCFHRYLAKTHKQFKEQVELMKDLDEIVVFPLFPQYCKATTGSVAKWFKKHLPHDICQKLRWIPSYSSHPGFIESYSELLQKLLTENDWKQEECTALCSFHGTPKSFYLQGDPYKFECEASFLHLQKKFPKMGFQLAYQSKFGPGEWLRPYTSDICEEAESYFENDKKIILIPLAFTSDHIETLSEMEMLYIQQLRAKGFAALRLDAIDKASKWPEAVLSMIQDAFNGSLPTCGNQLLIF